MALSVVRTGTTFRFGRAVSEIKPGDKFSRWTVTGFPYREDGSTKIPALCSCGKTGNPQVAKLLSGQSKSCGCLRNEIAVERTRLIFLKHGRCFTSEYRTWDGMIQRCTNPKNTAYKYYGARGISVCQRWAASFEDFLSDVGVKPTALYTLERDNNDGNYEPSNVVWATRDIQARNHRPRNSVFRKGVPVCR